VATSADLPGSSLTKCPERNDFLCNISVFRAVVMVAALALRPESPKANPKALQNLTGRQSCLIGC